MAILNPDAGGIPQANMPDQTRASRGQIADHSAGILIQGAGQAAADGVGLYNEYNHWQIDQSVRAGFDEANKPYEAANTTDLMPTDVTKAGDSIAALQTAYDQGKLSDVYYTGQLARLSKNLRSQYPQYETYLDSTIQNITGIRPANAFRSAVMQEFQNQAQNASDSEKAWGTYVKDNEGEIIGALPDFYQNPDKYDRNYVKSIVANQKADKLAIDKQSSENALLSSTNKLTTDRASSTATTALNQIVNTRVTAIAHAGSTDNVLDQVIQMTKNNPTPEQAQGMMQNLGQLQASTRAQLTQFMNTTYDPNDPKSGSPASTLGPDETKKQIDAAMAPIDDMIAYATNGQYGMISYYANLNKLKGDKDLNTVLNSSDEMAKENAFQKISPQLGQDYLTAANAKGGRNEDAIFTSMVPELASRVADGKDTLAAQVQRMADSNKTDKEKSVGITAAISANKATITSGHASPEEFQNAVDGIYGLQKDGSSIFKMIKPEEYNDLYKTMYSQDVTNAIVKSGDKGMMKTYLDSMQEAIQSTPDYRNVAKSIQDVQDFSKTNTISFDAGTGRLTVVTDPKAMDAPAPGGATGAFVQRQLLQGQVKSAVQAVSTLNDQFASLGKVLDGLGVTPEDQGKYFKSVVDGLGVDLSSGKKDDFFTTVGKAIQTGWAAMTSDPSKTSQGGGGGGWGSSDSDARSKIQGGNTNFHFDTPPDKLDPQTTIQQSGAADPAGMLNGKTPVDIAKSFLGDKETDPEQSKVLSAFIKNTTGTDINPQTTAWCAAFMNSVLQAGGQKGTGSLAAKSFLSWGESSSDDPKPGDVVVLKRKGGEAWQGHVGFFEGFNDDGTVKVLAGNQGNAVSESNFSADDVLDFRRASPK